MLHTRTPGEDRPRRQRCLRLVAVALAQVYQFAMSALQSPRMERFARYYLETGNAAASYLRAGYKPSTRTSLDPAASKLTRSHKVKARIRELQAHLVNRNRITVDSLVEELEEARLDAKTRGQPATAVSAILAKAKLAGLLVERRESGTPGEFAGLQSEADVLAKVRAELGEDAAAALAKALERTSESDLLEPTHQASDTRQ